MKDGASEPLATPRLSGAVGEACTVYFEREFERNAVKLLPGEYFVSGDDIVLSTVLGSCVAACMWDRTAKVGGMNHFMLPGEAAGSRPGPGGDPLGRVRHEHVLAAAQPTPLLEVPGDELGRPRRQRQDRRHVIK